MTETMEFETLKPKWENNPVAIAMSSSEEYLPYLSVCLQSLVDNSSIDNKYDIIIFSSAPESYKKQLIIDTYTKENISIRFYNPKKILENVKMSITHSYFNEACYYRITAPEVLPEYKKIIFTDIDLIFKGDINELAQIDIGEAPLAACREPIWEYFIKQGVEICGNDIKTYSKNVLNLTDINIYYNTGVVVINVSEFKKYDYFNQLKDLINNNFFIYQEQCALNKLLNDKIYELSPIWNCEISSLVNNDILSAKIVHFLGGEKPWVSSDSDKAEIWWRYARKTPFYETLMLKLSAFYRDNLACAFSDRKNVLNYWKCKLLSKITFGTKKLHYLNKKNMIKNKILIGKKLRNI